MKLRIVKLTQERFIQMLLGKTPLSNLPSDVEVLDVKMDLFARQITILVRSESFEDVTDTYPIPEVSVEAELKQKTTIMPMTSAKSVKVEVRAPQSITRMVPPQPDSNRWASKMENEFSPDERKLLSFTVKDDVIIVKPITFLKTEWEDINETVRSLGGKWVKGDIISYWEIPLQ
jgi:hypothetical protein